MTNPDQTNKPPIIPCYTGSTVKVSEGDVVEFDGYRGTIEKICLPFSDEAIAYACEQTGGLLIDSEDFGLMLEPFGFGEEIHLVERKREEEPR